MSVRKWSRGIVSGNKTTSAILIGALKFAFAKPPGGGAFLVNPDAVAEADLVKIGNNGNASNFYRPDDDKRWGIPAVRATLKRTVIAPGVLMGDRPIGFNIPFSGDWAGSEEILSKFDVPGLRGLWYTFAKSASQDVIGGYIAKPITLDENWSAIYAEIKWPTHLEIFASIPSISYERICSIDYSYKVLADEFDAGSAGAVA